MALTDHGALYGAVAFYPGRQDPRASSRSSAWRPTWRLRSMTSKEGKADTEPVLVDGVPMPWYRRTGICVGSDFANLTCGSCSTAPVAVLNSDTARRGAGLPGKRARPRWRATSYRDARAIFSERSTEAGARFL